MGRHASLAVRLFVLACVLGSPLTVGLTAGVAGTSGTPGAPAAASDSSPPLSFSSGSVTPTPRTAGPAVSQTAAPESTPGVSLTVERPSSAALTVTATYDVPPSVHDLRVVIGDLPVEESEGFERCESNRLCWDGSTTDPTVMVRRDLSTRRGTYRGIVNDSLAFVPTPRLYTVWRTDDARRTAPLFAEREYASFEVVGERTVLANATLFHGPHTEYERTADDGTTFRLIIPKGTRLGPPRDRLFDALSGASSILGVGGENREVIAVALADPSREMGAGAGLAGATVGNAFWARAGSSLSSTRNVWLHEYVHTRQRFADRDREMEWFVEASAEYYAARLAYELGLVGELEYEWELKSRRLRTTSSELADPATWERPNVPYRKGALVLASLDAEIRNRTDGARTLEAVFRRLNRAEGTLTYPLFVEHVVAVSNDPAMEEWLDRYVQGAETPQYDPQEPQERLPNAPRMDEVATLVPTTPVGFGVGAIALALATMLTLSVLSTVGRTLQRLVEMVFDGLGWLADLILELR
jgi:hypothetical protein